MIGKHRAGEARVMRLEHELEWLRRSKHAGQHAPQDEFGDLRVRRTRDYLRRSSTVFNVKDFGAKGDGTADDTTAIQRAIDAAGAAAGSVLVPAGVYNFSSALGIRGDRTELVGLGASRLVATTLLDRLIDSNNFSYLRFEGLTIQGSGVQTVGGRGTIHLDGGSTYCVVSHCRLLSAPGTAIADDGTRNVVTHNVVDGTGEHGIYSSSGVCAAYHGNHLRNIGRVPGTTLGCHGISLAGSSWCTVEGNAIANAAGVGIALRDGTRFCSVRGNAIHAGTDRHVALGTASDCTIVGNTMSDVASGTDAIRIDGGGRYIIADNIIERSTAGGAGIRWITASVTGGDDVYGNLILLDGASISQYGIDCDSRTAVDVLIHGNTIRALNRAAPPGAVRVTAGTRARVYDNVTTAG